MPVTHLDISNTSVSELSPLRGMPLQELHASFSQVNDLSALEESPLRIVTAEGTSVSRIGRLAESPLLECAVIGARASTATRIQPPKPGRGWVNRLGMRFDPALAGGTLLVSHWETRRSDFRAYVKATAQAPSTGMITLMEDGVWDEADGLRWEDPPFEQQDNHPVIGVSYNDAVSFCKWLTAVDREAGILGKHAFYRLPTSSEWSLAAGLLTGAKRGPYPWGSSWPATRLTGNYPTQMPRLARNGIQGYNDGYAFTCPVDSFRESVGRFADMGGNVREWCLDEIGVDNGENLHVIRGSAWGVELSGDDSYKTLMKLSREELQPSNARWSNLGFRIVVDLGLGY